MIDRLVYDAVRRISIHALRVEGDLVALYVGHYICPFLSTPSGWRATYFLFLTIYFK